MNDTYLVPDTDHSGQGRPRSKMVGREKHQACVLGGAAGKVYLSIWCTLQLPANVKQRGNRGLLHMLHCGVVQEYLTVCTRGFQLFGDSGL